MSQHVPEFVYKIYSVKEAQEYLRLSKGCVGAIIYRAGQFSAYKLITQIVEMLVERGVNLQTETPVTKVSRGHKNCRWLLETPRGNIMASKVVFATNGYIQNLVPSFTVIKPTRDSMTVQTPPRCLSEPQLDRSYIFFYKDDFDYLIVQSG